MDLPIPRSNMYKYIALTGVALIIVTLVASISALFDVHDQILEAEEQIALAEARLEAGKTPEGEAPESSLEQELDRIRLEAAEKRLELWKERSLELREWATIVVTIGIAISAFGFTRWYRKIQLPMEHIASRQAEIYVRRADTE